MNINNFSIKPSDYIQNSPDLYACTRNSEDIVPIAMNIFIDFPPSTQIFSFEKIKRKVLIEANFDYKFAKLVIQALAKLYHQDFSKKFGKLEREFTECHQGEILKCLQIDPNHKPNNKALDFSQIPQTHLEAISAFLENGIHIQQFISAVDLNEQSAGKVLQSIKLFDLELDKLAFDQKTKYVETTYPLRTLCLQASEGTLHSFEAYTKDLRPDIFEKPFSDAAYTYAGQNTHYIPERVRDRSRVLTVALIELIALSRRLGHEANRIFYCIAGNTGVGKTHRLRLDPRFQNALVDNELVGSLNPDRVKALLRKEAPRVTNHQIHVEGYTLSDNLRQEVMKDCLNASCIIDQRLNILSDVDSIHDIAKFTRTKIVHIDIEGPLLLSCLRVLGRDPRIDPCVPFRPISSGYKNMRMNRGKIQKKILEDPLYTSYSLWAADKDSPDLTLVLEKNGNSCTIHNQELLNMATSSEYVDAEIEEVSQTQLTKNFMDRASTLRGVKKQAFLDYKGLAIENALDRHAKKLTASKDYSGFENKGDKDPKSS